MASFFACGSPSVFQCDGSKPIYEECDYDVNPPQLYTLVHTRQWAKAMERMKSHKEEASVWVHRMGIEEPAADGTDDHRMMSPRNAEGGENVKKVMRWRMLPIHASIIFSAPVEVVMGLLEAYPSGSTTTDDQGMLPLHLAFRSQSSEEVVLALLNVFPEAMEVGDLKGRVPSMLAPKNTKLNYHDVIADAFLSSPSCYYHAARVASVDRARIETDLTAEIAALHEKTKKDMVECKNVYESKVNDLNVQNEQLAFENAELKEKVEWFESKCDGADEKEQVLVDHTNSLAERLRLTSLSEEHLATKLAKLESKLVMKTQELDDYKDEAKSQVSLLEARIQELEKALDKTHNKAKALTEKLQEKVQESNETAIKYENERKVFEKQIDASRQCLMELIAGSKEEKRLYDQDSKALRTQLQAIQDELSRNHQVPQSIEERLDSLQREIVSSRMNYEQEKVASTDRIESMHREILNQNAARRDEAQAMIQAHIAKENGAASASPLDTYPTKVTSSSAIQTPAPTIQAHSPRQAHIIDTTNTTVQFETISTQDVKKTYTPDPTAENAVDDGIDIYVSQTRDDTDCYDDAESLVALTELTNEQREALENLDLSGSKEEIAATLSRVPGLTKNQVNLLVDVAASLAV